MALLDTVADVSAATKFSELRLSNVGLTKAFNDSGLWYALKSIFTWPHAKLYVMPNGDRCYVPGEKNLSPPEGSDYRGKVVFFENPRDQNAAYSIRQSMEGIEDGKPGTSYTVFAHGVTHERGRTFRTSKHLMTISGVWASGTGVNSPLKDVEFIDAQGVREHGWQELVTLDLLLKSRPLAQNPLWSAPKL